MYEKLFNLYASGKINDDEINRAIGKGWITNDQASEIIKNARNTEDTND